VADKKSKPEPQATDLGAEGGVAEQSLGQLITETRERKGLTREQVATEAHLPPHYVKMIETDSYDLISDRLYLVPFLRRYAAFLGLDAEEIASRFVSNVQHAEANVVRISQELTMVAKKPGALGRIAFGVMIAAILALLANMAWRRYEEHKAPAPAPVPSPAAMATAQSETIPPATSVTNPESVAHPSAPAPASNMARPVNVPLADKRPDPPKPIPRAPTD
jgi:cytoskeleton protein RodZ